MVKKDSKMGRLEKALDRTLDQFLGTIHSEQEEEENPQAQVAIEDFVRQELGEAYYQLDKEEVEMIEEISREQGRGKEEVIKLALQSFAGQQGEEQQPSPDTLLTKDYIRNELSKLRNMIEQGKKGDRETELNRKEITLLLSYLRHLERSGWET